ncbi:hypothetical protein [uncultured Roseibium sp.]|uniref:hypothetical protein n=1 Tax=uncultured Roseibium sp. TaxID=1936171 RepID=UPI003216661A
MRREGELPSALSELTTGLLDQIAKLRTVLSKETREFVEFVEETVIQLGWENGRMAYRAYATTKTLLIGIGRFLKSVALKLKNEAGNSPVGFTGGAIGIGLALASGAGSLQGLSIDPAVLETARQFSIFFQQNANAIVAFAAGSQELRLWLQHILEMVEADGGE